MMEIKDRKPVGSHGVWKEGENGLRKGRREIGWDPAVGK